MSDLKREKSTGWSGNHFELWGLPGWAVSILNGLLWVVIIVVVVLVVFLLLLKCFSKFSDQVFVINKKGEVVEEPREEAVELAALPWRKPRA